MKVTRCLFVLMLLGCLLAAYAWAQNGATYSLRTLVLDESAGRANSANSKLEVSSVGQPTPVGESSSANFRAFAGYLYTLEVSCAPAPVIATALIPNANKGCPYSAFLEIQSGTGTSPLAWTIINGALASGLSLNESTGEIAGVPTDTGHCDFTVQVEDLCLAVDTMSFSLPVDPYASVKGDPTGDCTINVLDVLTVANIILEWIVPTEDQIWRADCNGPLGACAGDGAINVLDAVKIANIILFLDECP